MGAFSTDATRWAAVQSRDPAADGAFVYCVRTTKIFCRPICKARPARRANITFRDTARDAEKAGFRACKRCKPEHAGSMPDEEAVRKIRAFVQEHHANQRKDMRLGSLRQMAESTGLSKWHFHRVFKKVFGMTPKEWVSSGEGWNDSRPAMPATTEADFDKYMQSLDWDVFRAAEDTSGVTSAFSDSNDGDASLFFDLPHVFYTLKRTSFGILLLAYQDAKLCLINQAFTESELMAHLHDAFPVFLYRHSFFDAAELSIDHNIRQHATSVVDLLEQPLGVV